jgi:hypothetical protein
VLIGMFLLSASPIWVAVPNDPRLKIVGGVALLVGAGFFRVGFSVFKRFIENLPTSIKLSSVFSVGSSSWPRCDLSAFKVKKPLQRTSK